MNANYTQEAAPDKPRAAVLVAAGIVGPSGAFADFPIEQADLVLEVCRRLEVRQLWLARSALERLRIYPTPAPVPSSRQADAWRYGRPHAWTEQLAGAGWELSTEPAGLAPWLELQRGQERLDVVLPAWDLDNPFGAATGARELLDALGLLARYLGLRYRRSPSVTGLTLMRAVHARGLPWPEAHLAGPATEPRREPAALWLTEEALPAEGWLHAWDLNGMYLAACSSAELGFGEPVHHERGHKAVIGHVGYWQARIRPPAGALPGLPFLADGKSHWYTAPALDLARELGCTIAGLGEAWVYPERHRWLEPWYGRLRDAREALLEGSEPGRWLALAAVKAIYSRSIGRLAGSWLEEGAQTFRPDWRDVIVARARANLYRHLRRIEQRTGCRPAALNADAVMFWHPYEEPERAAADLGLEVSPQLGKWKYLGRVPAGAAGRLEGGPHRRARRLFDELRGQ